MTNRMPFASIMLASLAGCDANYDLICTATLGDEVSASDSNLGYTAEDVWDALPGERTFTPAFEVEAIPATFSSVTVAFTRRDGPIFRAILRSDGDGANEPCTVTTEVLAVPAHADLTTDDGSLSGGVDLYVASGDPQARTPWTLETGDAAVEPVLTEVALPEDWLPTIEAESGDIEPAEPFLYIGEDTSAPRVLSGYRGPLASGEGDTSTTVLTFDLTPMSTP